jgi:hypothetical protein
MIKFLLEKRKKVAVLFFVLMISSIRIGASLSAQTSPPSFPSCQEKIFISDGDWAHYDYGIHGIPGIDNLEGGDDVYSLTAGNFLQCFCPVGGDDGIQTNWWNVERANLSQDEVDQFVNDGWIKENGAGWNLFDENYLAKNQNFSCAEPTSTPTSTSTPTPTVTMTPTPTPKEEESRCTGLSASPVEGTATLTVKFTGSGYDPDGDIQGYEFNFGDKSGGQDQIIKQDGSEATHRYESAGEYVASLRVEDSHGDWKDGQGDCRRTIKVTAQPQVLGEETPEQLPETGTGIFLTAVAMLGWGIYLYKNFRLV